jgi:hypothetical protein
MSKFLLEYWFFIRVNGGLEKAFAEDLGVFHSGISP